MRVLLSIFLMLATAACGGDFESASRLHGLRLLAVEADKPSARPGDTVQLHALFYDEHERPLEWGFALCDGSRSSAALDCLHALDVATLEVRDEPLFTLTMPSLPEGLSRDTAQGVAVIVCPGHIVAGDTQGIPIACLVDDEPLPIHDFEVGVKRIYYELNSTNNNPQITGVRWNGAHWPEQETKQVIACSRDTDDVEKCASAVRNTLEVDTDTSGEAYVDAVGGESREQTVVQLYANGGTFEHSVRTRDEARTRFIARAEDVGRTLTLFIVVRDSRGGVSFQTRRVEVLGS